jgi:hypothetical protein
MIVRAELVAWKTVSALTGALHQHHHRTGQTPLVLAILKFKFQKNNRVTDDTSSHERASLGLSAARKQQEFTMALIGTALSDQVYVLWHNHRGNTCRSNPILAGRKGYSLRI